MSLANDDPESFDRAQIEHSTKQIEFPTRISNEVGRYEMSSRLIDVLGEQFDAVQIHVVLKNAEDIIKNALELNKESCLLHITEKEMTIFGAKVVTRRSTEYDYSETVSVATKEAQIKALTSELKLLKDQLKILPAQEMVNPSNGEIYFKAKLIKDGIVPAITLPK